jgi:hypothetical protein
VGGIVPLILGIYLYLQTRLVYLYIVIRAIWATMLGAFCELLGGVKSLSNRNQMSLIFKS